MKQQDLKLDIKFLVDRINNIAQMVIDMVLSNTAKGKSYINDGIDFPAYSRKPFSQPYGSFLRDVQGRPVAWWLKRAVKNEEQQKRIIERSQAV